MNGITAFENRLVSCGGVIILENVDGLVIALPTYTSWSKERAAQWYAVVPSTKMNIFAKCTAKKQEEAQILINILTGIDVNMPEGCLVVKHDTLLSVKITGHIAAFETEWFRCPECGILIPLGGLGIEPFPVVTSPDSQKINLQECDSCAAENSKKYGLIFA